MIINYMGSWNTLSLKYNLVYVDSRGDSSITLEMLTTPVVDPSGELDVVEIQYNSQVVVACRGQSFSKLKQSSYPESCDLLMIVNDWHPAIPRVFVEKHANKTVNYLTQMSARRKRFSDPW